MLGVFRIKREERVAAAIVLVFLVALNVLAVAGNHFELFTRCGKLGYWSLFWNHYIVSGFDCYSYIILSQWRPLYVAYRHPLLSLMLWPLSKLNEWLMGITGHNCAIFIVAFFLILLMFYSFLFVRRILREVIELHGFDATLLSIFLYSFAYITLTSIVPDHFAISMFILTLTLYVAGRDLQKGRLMKGWKVALYYFIASGVTLTNGVKIFLADWFVNGCKAWHWRNLLFTFAFPTAILLGCYLFQEQGVVAEEMQKRQHIVEQKMKKDSTFAARQKQQKRHNNVKMNEGKYMDCTYEDIPVGRTLIENVFGESIQLHDQYLLKDVGRNRPVFVSYSHWWNYAVEALVVLLFLGGIWMGRKERFLWLCLSWLAFDATIHLILGFAIIEPYIMTAHWAFIIPIATAYFFRATSGKFLWGLRTLILLLTVYLFTYNGYWLFKFFC